MGSDIPSFLIFIAGVAIGSIGTLLLPRLNISKKRRTELMKVRSRILADIKEHHEQEIRREIFQTTEALRSELRTGLNRLVNSTERLLGQVHEEQNGRGDRQIITLKERA
jgi:hypothetical protein